MPIVGMISKMHVRLGSLYVEYDFVIGEERIFLNPYVGQTVSLRFTGKILCVGCGRVIKKSYQGGYCFPCTQRLAQCDFCILKPDRCHYHIGTCREPQWGMAHCMVPHYVYLANAAGLKVGITRFSQVPVRWMDQGATQALAIMEVPTRRVSGLIEAFIAKKMSDRTPWQKMLKGETPVIHLEKERDRLIEDIQHASLEGCSGMRWLSEPIVNMDYPVVEYPKKITALSWDKTPHIEGTLLGIRGQYLLLDTGVVNIRKHSGYILEWA